jgi:hypothetical protein
MLIKVIKRSHEVYQFADRYVKRSPLRVFLSKCCMHVLPPIHSKYPARFIPPDLISLTALVKEKGCGKVKLSLYLIKLPPPHEHVWGGGVEE